MVGTLEKKYRGIRRLPQHLRSWSVDLNQVGACFLIGTGAGILVIGVGMRLAMRMVALIVGMAPAFTISGTVAILLVGMIAGTILSFLYVPIYRWIRYGWGMKGVLLGIPFSILIGAAFFGLFGAVEGEAALAGSWIGAGLFAPLPILFGLVLAYCVNRLQSRIAAAASRNIHLGWFMAVLAILSWAFSRLAALGDKSRTPSTLIRWFEDMGIAFHEIPDVQSLIGLIFVLLFLGLHMGVIWLHSSNRVALLTSVGQLLLASISIGPDSLPSMLRVSQGSSAAEWLLWTGCLTITTGAVWWTRRCNRVVVATAMFAVAFLLMWLILLLSPGMQLRNLSALQTMLAVAPFLWPWLLLPLGMIIRPPHRMRENRHAIN